MFQILKYYYWYIIIKVLVCVCVCVAGYNRWELCVPWWPQATPRAHAGRKLCVWWARWLAGHGWTEEWRSDSGRDEDKVLGLHSRLQYVCLTFRVIDTYIAQHTQYAPRLNISFRSSVCAPIRAIALHHLEQPSRFTIFFSIYSHITFLCVVAGNVFFISEKWLWSAVR